ncbi:hypothetical protein TREMEDRAFT_61525 [Tremella mesenterica DSM 1558]|uniref:uncharacterized protein n=1 Tax=Tremella mesenterica (strain ATCC 24925 / CBS 8224 / DSM 1558 / NBRC 9311 / NRRL Y-6157 / RJB 2259-6 / UBC 559-6) TaxID=578456 RepID=UPI0003F497EE|nr:uncharacterized protein TREMEDRAFT_61525 [Tremella mesenterica DSM 1558]EIW69761.1 hypothetical protein TREMEDRAFT_61525 [Tremella mesenterica DSM 1558]
MTLQSITASPSTAYLTYGLLLQLSDIDLAYADHLVYWEGLKTVRMGAQNLHDFLSGCLCVMCIHEALDLMRPAKLFQVVGPDHGHDLKSAEDGTTGYLYCDLCMWRAWGSQETNRETRVNQWLSKSGLDTHLEAKRTEFVNTLSEALTVLQDDMLLPRMSSNPELAQIIQYSRQNLIDTLSDYISGRGDKTFNKPSHTHCYVLNASTGCGNTERTLGELSKSVGDFVLAFTPLTNPTVCASSHYPQESLRNPFRSEEDDSENDNREEEDIQDIQDGTQFDSLTGQHGASRTDGIKSVIHPANFMLKSLTKASMILISATDMAHTGPQDVLNRSFNLPIGMNAHNGLWKTKDMEQLWLLLEGMISGHKPRDLLTAASNEVEKLKEQAKTKDLDSYHWSSDEDTFRDKPTLTSTVKLASSRIQLAHWGVTSIMGKTPMWDTSGVFSIRELEKDICEKLISLKPSVVGGIR